MDTSKNDIVNALYQSTLLVVGYSYLMKRFLSLNIGPPSQASLQQILKLGGVVAISNISLDYLYQQGIIPQNIIK
jgi:hypothetical protein